MLIVRTYSVLRWEHLRLSLGSWAHPFFTSQNQVLISEPETSRRSDATVQRKGQMQAVGKPSLGFSGAKIWPYVFVDYNWLVQPNVDFHHSSEAHEKLELEGQSRDTHRCRWGAAFHKPAKKLIVCFFWIVNHLTAFIWPKFTCIM